MKFILFKALAAVLFVFALVELGLYFSSPSIGFDNFQRNLLRQVWFQEKVSLLSPPFNIISDVGWDNSKRLESLYPLATLPANQDYTATDFLREKSIFYHVHINSLGFRGPEVDLHKKKSMFRWAAYGSYLTFGHGVDDNQSWPALTEKILNQKAHNFEVLNGGLETGTLILGLARLQHELKSLQIDGVILEYGFVDGLTLPQDSIAPDYFKLRGIPPQSTLNESFVYPSFSDLFFFKYLKTGFFKNFYIATALINKIEHLQGRDHYDFQTFTKALTTTCQQLRQQKKEVVLIYNPFLPSEVISELERLKEHDRKIMSINLRSYFSTHPPSSDDYKKFDSDPENFLAEAHLTRESSKKIRSLDYFKFAPYYQSIFQLSPLGQERVAQAVAEQISGAKLSPPN